MTGRLTDGTAIITTVIQKKICRFPKVPTIADRLPAISTLGKPTAPDFVTQIHATHSRITLFSRTRRPLFSHCDPLRRLIVPSGSGILPTGCRNFIASARTHSLHLIFTDLRCQHWHGKVCDVLHQMEFAAHHPCQASLGWDDSEVALPIPDSALRRFD